MQIDNNVRLNEALISGEMHAFRILFTSIYPSLLSFVTTLTQDKDQAKDIVQLAFIYVWKKRQTLNRSSNIKNLLFVAAKNIYIDQYRSDRSRVGLYVQLAEESVEEDLENREYVEEQIRKLRKVIQDLPPRCREILTLTKFNGLTRAEVADYLNISVKTVESQIRLAYKRIREAFETEKKSFILFLLHKALKPQYLGEL